MRSNRVSGLVGSVASVGMIFLFCAGAGLWAQAQPRAANRTHAVANHQGSTVHAAHAGYVRIGNIHGRAVYGRTTASGHTAAYGRRPVHRAGARPAHAQVDVNVAVSPVYPAVNPPYPAGSAWYALSTYPYFPYGYYLYQADLSGQGYSDGFHRGQDDAEDGRSYDPYRKGYKYP